MKSHLSGIEEEEAKRIEDDINKKENKKQEKEIVKKEKIGTKKEEKAPVIIRREVIISQEAEQTKKKEPVKKENKKNNVGFVERKQNKDYNIVYRNKPSKPMTVSELFGLKKEEPKKEEKVKVEQENKKEEMKKEEVKEVKKEETLKKVALDSKPQKQERENKTIGRENKMNRENRDNRQNRNNYGQNSNNYNNNNRNNNRFNHNNNRFNNNNSNNNGRFNGNNNNNGNNRFNNRNNNDRFNKRPLDEKGIEKNIKNIMSVETVEKESVREYNRGIDKQKNNNKFEENKGKKSKSRRNNSAGDFDEGKLKSLKQANRLSNMFDEQDGGMLDYYDLTTERGRRGKKRKNQNQEERTKQKIFQLTEIEIPETVTVKDLAADMKKTTAEVIKKLLGYGIMATIMGHVDHGKTSLLDAVRKTNVIEGEAGGITQAIGAYKVKVKDREITFLDTPGHEAFTAMRARGAQITDIAILVVAANDGVKPQTIEAINHAKSAGIPIIVAINKIDLPDANIEKVKQELMAYELVPEEWGGDTIYVPISAKKGENIDQLLEMVLLEADVLELKANPHKQAKGAVIEARLDKSKGAIATMLVQRGTLDVGDTIVVGSSIGRIRAMKDDKGKSVKAAGPSTPVEIMGLTEVPEAGDTFYEVKNEKMAKHLIERRKRQAREKAINSATKVTLDNLFTQMEQGNLKVLNLIVKADVQGSVEAVKQAMEKLENEEVKVKVIHAAAGAVNQSDVTLAKVSNAIIIAFNVRPDNMAKEMAEKDEVEIKQYSIIYQAIEDVEAAMKGMLDPKYEEKVIGNAEVRQTFKISNVGTIAGCYVISGKVERNAGVRVIRENLVIHYGHLATLKRFKDDVKEVTKGFECGIQIENYNDIKEGDVIEVYIMEEIKR